MFNHEIFAVSIGRRCTLLRAEPPDPDQQKAAVRAVHALTSVCVGVACVCTTGALSIDDVGIALDLPAVPELVGADPGARPGGGHHRARRAARRPAGAPAHPGRRPGADVRRRDDEAPPRQGGGGEHRRAARLKGLRVRRSPGAGRASGSPQALRQAVSLDVEAPGVAPTAPAVRVGGGGTGGAAAAAGPPRPAVAGGGSAAGRLSRRARPRRHAPLVPRSGP